MKKQHINKAERLKLRETEGEGVKLEEQWSIGKMAN